jgi:UrcA family protein
MFSANESGEDIIMEYNKILSACAAVAVTATSFVLVSTPLHAKSPIVVVVNPDDIVTRHISYADLNLASVAGERTLEHRVGSAIKSLCEEATGDSFTSLSRSYPKCRTSAWGQARPQLANAAQRARDIALTGTSTIAAVAITIDLSK